MTTDKQKAVFHDLQSIIERYVQLYVVVFVHYILVSHRHGSIGVKV